MNNNLFIRTYGINLDGHVHHDYHQVLIPVLGDIDLYMEDKHIHAHYGDAVFIPKGVFHQFKSSEQFRFVVMNSEQLTNDIEKIENIANRQIRLDQKILSYLIFVNQQLTTTHDAQIEQSMCKLLSQLLANLIHNQPKTIDRRIQKVIHQLNINPTAKHSIKQLAEVACLSPSHFKTLFKQQLNCTPLEYLTDLRMKKAIGLLRHTDLPITLIAEQCGYQSSSSLSRRFHQHYHQSPLQFRHSQQA